MIAFRPRRTILYVPAVNARAVEKARTLPADCIVLDLEDSVAPDAKADARAAAVAAVQAGGWGRRELLVRVNALDTPFAEGDFAALAATALDALLLPKVRNPADAARGVALAMGKPLWAMAETARAFQQIDAIADTAGVAALVAGFADLGRELRARAVPDRTPMLYAASRLLMAARAAGIVALDGVFTTLDDPAGLAAEAQQAADLGFDGKTCIHPAQLESVNRAFSPTAAEIAHAQGLIAAHRAARAQGAHVATFKGRMIEALHVLEAEHTLKIAEVVSEMGGLAARIVEAATE